MYRRAPFIWIPEQSVADDCSFVELLRDGAARRDDGVNRWFLFRRSFRLEAEPKRATLEITVDGRYQLFINGRRLGRGPCRSSPYFLRYDTHDVASALTAGDNVVAVLVHVYGVDTGWYERAEGHWQTMFGDGGLYCFAEIGCANALVTIRSDADWRCLQSDAWNSATPRSGWGQDFIEELDGRKLPGGWTEVGFDDQSWPRASLMEKSPSDAECMKGWGTIEPFPTLVPSELPPLLESPVAAQSVVAVYDINPEPDLPIDRRIYDEQLMDLPAESIPRIEHLLTDDDKATMLASGASHDIGVLLKFEPLRSGYPFIDFEASGGEIIEIAVAETILGEYSGDLPAQPRPMRESHLDCARVARYTARAGRQRFGMFDWSAVRYLFLVIRNALQGIRVHRLGCSYVRYPVEERGAFECSDSFLTRLWDVGRYTALQCTHDAWIDGPGREKRQWIGDGLVHYAIDAAAFGPSTSAVDRQFLLQAMESQRPDGLLQMFTPGDHHRTAVLIPDFCLHWICAAQMYLLHTGDDDTIEQLFPAVQRVLAWFERQLGPNELMANVPYWHFIEWADVGRDGEPAIINAMLAGALNAASELAKHLGNERARQRYAVRASRIADALNARHWSEARELYVDTVDPETGTQGRRISQHANAAMILWDIAPQERWAGIVSKITDTDDLRLTAVPPIVNIADEYEPDVHIIRTNTYFSHFVYSALAKARRFDLAIEQMRRQYRPMLEAGATTLWESYEPTASTCHAFSASPVYQLSAHALGVKPLAPGFTQFGVEPQPGNLTEAHGRYPSVLGDIAVEWRRDEYGFDLTVAVPEGAVVKVSPPPGYVADDASLEFAAGRHRMYFDREP